MRLQAQASAWLALERRRPLGTTSGRECIGTLFPVLASRLTLLCLNRGGRRVLAVQCSDFLREKTKLAAELEDARREMNRAAEFKGEEKLADVSCALR